ncbi:uncharacterized protein LOC117111761 [Anneissia japonica]|uniref:uncharacterized protein LOC117111761 n=1 Tax=Anneissia japonica TaxID=1529436 RepID=UPI001425B936|nr:uncharacterized protein LOC117111761 [Anneissia japonica]
MASLLPTSLFRPLPSFVSDEFKFQILKRFRDGEIGSCCREDPIICLFGKTLYTKMKRKQDKHVEVQKSVMSDMRKVATLYLEFKNLKDEYELTADAGEMLVRKNFNYLHEAVDKVTSCTDKEDMKGRPNSQIKAGLKISLLYLI